MFPPWTVPAVENVAHFSRALFAYVAIVTVENGPRT
ncbi:Uncharacterized protein APZ42_031760 [Daphnia magna]|uniref:Uncharacterized protein n=1 Tax=Daphnia magna TaxID=35525 RepID=A0A164MM02_9CRUS|nr:Uncharacterized protein APZ42_031760 [Daphnia magna]